MKGFIGLVLLAGLAFSQTTTLPGRPAPNTDDLPPVTIGVGTSWTRGNAYAKSVDVSIGLKLGSSNFYSYSMISTPVATVPRGADPLPSSVTTGGCYVAARSAGGNISLSTCGRAGFNADGTSYSLAATGSAAVAIKIPKMTNMFFVPYVNLAKPQRGTDGSLIGGILQPGLQIQYGFWK